MLSLKEQIKNLETIIKQNISPENKQILSKEITRLKQELANQKKEKQHFNESKWTTCL